MHESQRYAVPEGKLDMPPTPGAEPAGYLDDGCPYWDPPTVGPGVRYVSKDKDLHDRWLNRRWWYPDPGWGERIWWAAFAFLTFTWIWNVLGEDNLDWAGAAVYMALTPFFLGVVRVIFNVIDS